jgi:hypothetical protein
MAKPLRFAALALMLGAQPATAWELPKLWGGGSAPAPAAPGAPAASPAPVNPSNLDCPEILVESGAGELRAPPGADAGSVRYQISISHVARECAVIGDTLAIKVGVEGAAVLGPAGAPGSFSANLRIGVRRIKDEASLNPKTYHVTANVPAGAARGEFRLVADPITVPFTSVHAADDYEVIIAFAQGAGDAAPAKGEKKKRRRHGA